MLRKPWPIIVLTILFLIIPFLNLLLTYTLIKTDLTFLSYLKVLSLNRQNHLRLFNMFVPSIISGFAIYSVKKWSYPVFLTCMAWLSLQALLEYTPNLTLYQIVFAMIFPLLANILLVSYVLLPSVRAAYFDPRLRWWESKPRYLIGAEAEITHNNETLRGRITNLSEGGVFLVIDQPLALDSLIEIRFEVLDQTMNLNAKVVYQKGETKAYGIQFINLNWTLRKNLCKIGRRLQDEKYPVTQPVPVWTEDFINWAKRLITTGKGFTPEIPKK